MSKRIRISELTDLPRTFYTRYVNANNICYHKFTFVDENVIVMQCWEDSEWVEAEIFNPKESFIDLNSETIIRSNEKFKDYLKWDSLK